MSTAIRRALYGKLAADMTLTGYLAAAPDGMGQNIFHNQAPEDADYPMVVISKSSGVPTEAFHNPSILETDVWLIKGVDKNTTADKAEQIQARIAALLNDASLSISGGTASYLRRQSDVEYPEIVDGELFLHAGALFRLVHA